MDGLWTIIFDLPTGDDGICITIDKAMHLTGGNNNYYYIGNIEKNGDLGFEGRMIAEHFRGDIDPVFGSRTIAMEIKGEAKGGSMKGFATVNNFSIPFKGTKQE